MKFYDRENERHVLDEVLQQSRHEARMTVLMGRRRIGKTELSQRCGDDTVLYFFVGARTMYVRYARSWMHQFLAHQVLFLRYFASYSSCQRVVRSHSLSTNSRTS